MHLTLKQEVTRPPADTMLQQQEKLDDFRRVFNEERPHEALDMNTPSSVYTASERKLPQSLPDVEYPLHDETRRVGQNGTLSFRGREIYVSATLRGQPIGLRHVQEGVWLTTFMDTDLAYLNTSDKTVTPIPNNQEPLA